MISTVVLANSKKWSSSLLKTKVFLQRPKFDIYRRTINSTISNLDFSTRYEIDPAIDTGYKTFNENQYMQPSTKSNAIPINLNLLGKRDFYWYTGKVPHLCPGYDATSNALYSLPQVNLHNLHCSQQKLQDYFDNTWTLTELLFASLQGEEAFMTPPAHKIRHPLIFYYGHVATLYINKLRVAGVLKEGINAEYEHIFETGVDEMSWDDLSKNEMKWPTVAQVHQYRRKTYQIISNLISSLSDEECKCININSPLWALVMSFEHERIHLETSSVLINELPIKYVRFPDFFPNYFPVSEHIAASSVQQDVHYPINELIVSPATTVTIGKETDFPSFGWDNEYGSRTFNVSTFNAYKFLTTNGEFLEFVRDGGYAEPSYWTSEGWKWRAFRNTKWPKFWNRNGPQGLHEFELRLLFNDVAMRWDAPVSVNLHEAQAFAKWKSIKTNKKLRIMTEVENRAIRGLDNDIILDSSSYKSKLMNVNLVYSSMSPVNFYPPNKLGFYDVLGNAWEWTDTFFCALPGFKTHPFYEDFSTPCFDGKHHVIQGGSFISTGNEASIYSRFHFRPHFLQHASFRLMESLDGSFPTTDMDAPLPYVGDYPYRRSIPQDIVNNVADKAIKSANNNKVIDCHCVYITFD